MCDWGKQLAYFDILGNDVFMDIPLACNMTLQNMKFETIKVLEFEFTLTAHGKPRVLQLLGGQHLYFDLEKYQIKEYVDNLPGEVVDRYMISRILALSKRVLPEEFTFFDSRLDALTNIEIGYRDHFIFFSGSLV